MDMLSSLKSFFRPRSISIENWVFTLHSNITPFFLMFFGILVTGKQHFGDPIDCIPSNHIPTKQVNSLCWIPATFSLPDAWEKKVGGEVPYPGVDKYTPGENRVYNAYYRRVNVFLFFLALTFYAPKFFWKFMEGGHFKNLKSTLDSPTASKEKQKTIRELFVKFFLLSRLQNDGYFLRFIMAEIMSFINVVVQIFVVDAFLGGEFTTYGLNGIQFSKWGSELRYDSMIKVFPNITKCNFVYYGSSGDLQRYDSMCHLPINILNEKILIFLWFWFVILAIISGLALIYRFAVIKFKKIRVFSTKSRASKSDAESLKIVINYLGLDDWLILDLLAQNVDPLKFRDIVDDLAKGIHEKVL